MVISYEPVESNRNPGWLQDLEASKTCKAKKMRKKERPMKSERNRDFFFLKEQTACSCKRQIQKKERIRWACGPARSC